jgi:large subunit ribosomal protein L13e
MFLFPIVISKGKRRKGKGFSLPELKEAGINLQEAKKLGIYVDKRRKSVYEENVEYLRKLKNQNLSELSSSSRD